MKTWILILGVSATMVVAASCNKEETGDYICTCRDSNGIIADDLTIRDVSKDEAEDACSVKQDNMNDNIFDPEIYICRIE